MSVIEDDVLDQITFPLEVEDAISQVLHSKDPLDQPDFNTVTYINSIFPTEQSLSNIDEIITKFERKIDGIDDDMRVVIRGETNVSQDGHAALEEARLVIRKLLAHADKIKDQAGESENTVREITRDIKQLDAAKKNLTMAITTLNHLHMLVSGVDALQTLTKNRQYGEIILPLQGVAEVMQHFKNYRNIPQISQLSAQVNDIRVALAQQITADFQQAVSNTNLKHSMSLAQLAAACNVVSILDPQVRNELLKWFIAMQLEEYTLLFQESNEQAWLDKIDKRYGYIKRHLILLEDKFGNMFPQEWEVSERITVEFCRITRTDLTKLMLKNKTQLDVKLLLYAVQRTDNFENLLAKRFSGITLKPDASHDVPTSSNPFENEPYEPSLNPFEDVNGSEDDTGSQKTEASRQLIQHPFHRIIGQCFEPHLHVYVDSLDRNLADLMERFVADSKQQLTVNVAIETEATVLPSCADLFVFYKKCLVQCAQLSTSTTMLQLTYTFRKYLKDYALKVLQANLPKVTPASGSLTSSMSTLARNELAPGFIQNLVKDGEPGLKLDRGEQHRTCKVLTTAEYCLETIQQLEDKLKEKIDAELRERINMSAEHDAFHGVISSCIQLLVQDLETACDASLIAMTKMNWQGVESVGDQSPYVTAVTGHLKTVVPVLRDQLAASRKYFTQFCFKFVNVFIPKFITSLYKCSAISTVGAEQLLLDTHSLKTVLLDMHSIGSQVQRKPPPSYTKNVVKGMSKAEMILKVVMSPIEPEKAFVEQVTRLLPETDHKEFVKLLEMKGIKRSDQQTLIKLMKEKEPSVSQSVSSPDHGRSRILRLEKLIYQK